MASHILIVEDDRALAQTCARVLEAAGYSVAQAHDGVAAEEAVRDAPPALILLDMLLPRKDGRGVLAALAKSPATARIPVIAMSGVFKRRTLGSELTQAGVRAFLEKPFRGRDLLAEVASQIGAPRREATPPASAERLRLDAVPLAEIVWQVVEARASGTLHFEDRTLEKVLLFDEGQPVAVRSNALAETLGRMLVFRKRIDQATLERAMQLAQSREERLGQVLIDMGALSASDLDAELRAQAVQKVLDVFTWAGGQVWFEEDTPTLSFASALAGWTGRLMVLRGAARMPERSLLSILGAVADRRVTRTSVVLEPREQRQRNVAALLAELRLGAIVRDLLPRHAAGVYGLWIVGALDLGGERRPAPTGGGLPGTCAAKPAEDRRAELRALRDQLRAETYFQALGVAEDAAPDVVQRAYVALAKRYHPDRYAAEGEELKLLASEIFATLTTARETLTDADHRAEYVAHLAGESAGPERIHRAIDAERLYREGEALIRKRDYAGARRALAQACKLDPAEAEFHALYGWAHFVAANAEGGGEGAAAAERDALECLKRAIELAPESPKGYYYLAQIHKGCGRMDQAEKLLKKVLSLDPAHGEATQALRLIQMRKTKEPKAAGLGGGLFGMGRKKS